MLREFEKVRQDPDHYRRLFTDKYFDLFVWYSRGKERILGFQLCYDKGHYYRALTWEPDRGFMHTKIDEGEDRPGKHKNSPILVQDGVFEKERIAYKFKMASRHIDRDISELVFSRLLEYR